MLENPKAQEARAWLTARLEQGDLGEEERDLLTRVAQFPFERYPDYTCPWHLLKWPHQRWEYVHLIIGLIEQFRHVKGAYAGKPLTLEPFQVLILLCFLGPFDPLFGHRLVRTMLLTIARKNAKELSVDCPIPTPSGWVRNGDLVPGDRVFGADGRPCSVIAVSEVRIPDKAYRVHFSDGTYIDAGAGHQWLTRHRWKPWEVCKKGPRKGEQGVFGNIVEEVVTTEQIAQSCKYPRKDGKIEYNHSIGLCGPVQYPYRPDLEIDPYTLGVWLADGTSRAASVTLFSDDAEEILSQIPYINKRSKQSCSREGIRCARYKLGAYNEIVSRLKLLGIFNNKHIPLKYLISSVAQRKRLLQGILDGDGYSTTGRGTTSAVQISVKRQKYAEDLLELLRSLGFKPTCIKVDGKINGVVVGNYHNIQFTAYQDDGVFSLKRKQQRLKYRSSGPTRARRKKIVGCESIVPKEMRCIAVDSPRHLYLAGKDYVVTHNSSLTAASITAAMALRPDAGGYYRQDIFVGASDRDQAGEIYEMVAGFISQDLRLGLAEKFRCVPSSKVVQHYDSLTKLKVISSDAYRAHGRNAAAIIYDELGNIPSAMAEEYYNVLTSGFGAQTEAMAWLLSTQAPTDTHIFSSMVDACKRLNEGHPSEVENLAGFVFEVPDRIGDEDIDPYDETWWYLANPGLLSPNGLGRTLLPDLRLQAKEAKELPSLEAKFRNRRLNQRANPHSPVISASRWKACAEPLFSLRDLRGRRCWIGLDLSSTQDMTAAVLVFEEARELGGRRAVSPMFWLPRAGAEARERKDKVPYLTWARAGLINLDAEKVIEYRYVAQWMYAVSQDFEIVGVGYDRWRAEEFKLAARQEGLESLTEDETVFIEIYQSARYVEPCIEAVERALALEQITHAGNPILTWNASNALAVRNSDGHRKWDKAKSYGRIDGLVALGMALRCRELQEIEGDEGSLADTEEFAM